MSLLRPATAADLPALAAILAEPSVAAWWPGTDEARLAADLAEAPGDQLSVVVDGEVAGLAQLSEELDPDYRHGGLDVFLGTRWQGRGLGTRVVAQACAVLVDDRGHHRLTIDPARYNTRAIACYRRVGFRDVGVLRAYERGPDGRWRDGLLLDLLAPDLLRP